MLESIYESDKLDFIDMKIKETKIKIPSYEITSESAYLNRRKLIQSVGLLSLGVGISERSFGQDQSVQTLQSIKNEKYSTSETPNSYSDITTYNNFYEFGMQKSDPYINSGMFEPKPWSVEVSGEANITGTFDIEDLIDFNKLEERIYRLRCVEAWSMVIPWVGIPLSAILKKFEPLSSAKYVSFDTVYRPDQMPGQKRRILRWPYTEGLTIQEAMHPLTLMAVGIYGKELLNQNGAPMRLVIPWKYGFKSIKSINKIRFQERQPKTSWNISAPQEYGFYANVNPSVDHPRWSQARERRIGTGFFGAKQPTTLFNGYADEVADLYRGLNLRKYY
jgi:sulfoxide reductase catalytic subunit YedY|tara:strand:- start:20 stop:1021 length:1002 start_codon:yes stop_codon:yes gene_type:complete